MRTNFISRLALLALAGFLVAATQVWAGATLGWIAFGAGIAMIVLACADGTAPSIAQRGIDAVIVALGAWIIVAGLVFDGRVLEWTTFGGAMQLAALALTGLVVHELASERVVHELSVAPVERRTEAPIAA